MGEKGKQERRGREVKTTKCSLRERRNGCGSSFKTICRKFIRSLGFVKNMLGNFLLIKNIQPVGRVKRLNMFNTMNVNFNVRQTDQIEFIFASMI